MRRASKTALARLADGPEATCPPGFDQLPIVRSQKKELTGSRIKKDRAEMLEKSGLARIAPFRVLVRQCREVPDDMHMGRLAARG